MPESEASANDQDPRASHPQEPSHDKVLVDAIGYTKGLVALLDSLTDGFQRRGRELDDQRARLAILQSERRTILQERAEFDARITALTAERDSLRSALETRERELDDWRTRLNSLEDERRTSLQERAEFDARITALTAERDGFRGALTGREKEIERLRQDGASAQAALEGRTQEVEALQADADARITALTAERDSLRTALETRENELNTLRQSTTQTQAALEAQTRELEALQADADARISALTAERDSLRTALETRDQELTDQRTRLATLDDAHRTSLQERAEFDARISALTAERDSLRGALEAHEQEINRLRQDAAHGQAALEAQTREMQALRDGVAEPTRQADELREVVRSLERQLQRASPLPVRTPVPPAPGGSVSAAGGRATPQLDAAAFDEMFSDQRRPEDERVTALTAERDSLRGALEAHEQEINRLRQDAARGQAALEAQAREMQALQIGMAETVRQAEEIRKVLQALEKQVESAGRREAALEGALEAERRQMREAAVRASQEQDALREDLADAENLLAEARKDIGASQGVIASLQRTADEERVQAVVLRGQLEKQTADLARLQATVQAVPRLLNELLGAFGVHEAASVSGTTTGRADADVLAVLQAVRDACCAAVQPATDSEPQPSDLAMDAAELRRRADQIAGQRRRVVQQRSESACPAGPVPPEHTPRAEQGRTELEVREAEPERPPRPAVAEASAAPPVRPSGASPKSTKRPGSPSGMTVECTFPASETEAACILRGEIARINDMGLLAAFEERLPEGVPMVVRFVRDGEVLSCRGRVVRVQESAGTSVSGSTLHHLIRFESPVSAAGEAAPSSVS